MQDKTLKFFLVLWIICFISGCSFVIQTGRRSDVQKISELSQQIDDLSQAKSTLEEMLSREIQDKQVRLKMMERGLVVTFVADVLFDSGKGKLRPEAIPILNKVADVLQAKVPDLKVGIEGSTDNQSIKYSGWKSNWELSTARALSVLHHLVDVNGISPERLSAIGYGEFQPVASNDSAEGRKQNRRVEIVIIPKMTKVKERKEHIENPVLKEPQGNLK